MKHQPADLLFLVGFSVYVAIRHVYSVRFKDVKRTERRIDGVEKGLLTLVTIGSLLLPLLYLFTSWLDFAAYQRPAFLLWPGGATLVAALWLFYRSHADLGPNWSMTLELRAEHELVTQGVYRSVRHPMYTSIWLFGIAQALLIGNWLAGPAALVVFAPLYLLRTPREEQMMLDHFGDAYRDYMDRTGLLLPRRRPY